MLKIKNLISLSILLVHLSVFSQVNTIAIEASLDTINHSLQIQQKITYYNNSKTALNEIYLHNWANSFKGNKTPLGKRLIEDYKKDFYFSKRKDRGFSEVEDIRNNERSLRFNALKNQDDILKVDLYKSLKPNDSIDLFLEYTVKIPKAKFTGYGVLKSGYHLRFWYITPAVHQGKWQLMSNLNMDDLFEDVADYTIDIDLPNNYHVESNLYQYTTNTNNSNNYYLVGKSKKDIIINISTKKRFKTFQTKNITVKTDIFDKKIELKASNEIIKRQIKFIENFTGKHPHTEILVDANTVNKNSLQELYGIPSWLKPYPENFKWEVRFFKALTSKYIDDVLLLNKRKDYWLCDGIQTFLMMEYINKYYPNVTVFGRFSKLWGFRSYNLAKLKQNDKYSFLYQFSARRFYDQALTTPADSLSNFNRKVISQYKAGLGFRYLQDFLDNETLRQSFQEFYRNYRLKITSSDVFQKILEEKTNKDLTWFFGDYIQTSKKIDYKIKEVKYLKKEDSIAVTIKNKRNITAPVSLYAVKDKQIKFKTWVCR